MAFIASAIAGGAAIWGASKESDAAGQASQLQTQYGQRALDLQKKEFDQQQANNAPWMQAGRGALTQMGQMTAGGPPQFTQADFLANKDPAYGFDMQQGLNGVQASAAASGGLHSGGTMKALNNYAQGMASNEYQNAYSRFMNGQNTQFGRLASIAGMGQNATGMANNAAQNYGAQGADLLTGIGNAQAGSQLAQGQIWGSTISGIGSGLANNMSVGGMMSQMQGKNPYGGGALTSTGSGYNAAPAASPAVAAPQASSTYMSDYAFA